MIDIKKIKNIVEGQRNIIVAGLKRLRREDPFVTEDRSIIVEPGTDAAQLFSHERIVVLENQLKKELKDTESALKKIKKGTYGTCERCGKKIGEARLAVRPQAIYCLKCKSEIESKK